MAVRDQDTDRQEPARRARRIRSSRRRPAPRRAGRGPADGKKPEPARLPPSGRRLGRRAQRREGALARARADRRPARVLRMNHEDGGLRLPRLRLAGRPEGPAPRHLRERHQARHLGDDAQAGRPRLLRRAHGHRARRAGPTSTLEDQGRLDRADDLRRRPPTATCRSPGTTRSRWSARRCAASTARTRRRSTPPGRLEQRGDVPLPAVGARVRHEQPAGLLEHVPRGERPRADRGDRHRQGHGRPRATGSRPTRSS